MNIILKDCRLVNSWEISEWMSVAYRAYSNQFRIPSCENVQQRRFSACPISSVETFVSSPSKSGIWHMRQGLSHQRRHAPFQFTYNNTNFLCVVLLPLHGFNFM